MASLTERLDNFPEPWKPKNAGEKLIGELTDVDMRDSEYGDPYPILTILVEEGQEDGQPLTPGTEKAWHAFHTMARNEVAKKKPQIGERVGVVYAGLGEAAPGMNAPVRWRVVVDRAKQAVIDYGDLAADDEPPTASHEQQVDEVIDEVLDDLDKEAGHADDDIPF